MIISNNINYYGIYIHIYIYICILLQYNIKDFPKERYCTPYLSLVPLKMKFKMNLTINTRWRNSI